MSLTYETVALVIVAPGVLYAVVTFVSVLRSIAAAPRIPPAAEPASWPKVSLIVPARNEESTLAAATAAKLACEYPNLELVLVEDRSTDDTPRVADEIAARDPRVRVIHVRELPEGWLGKLHALDQGVRASTGEWLLFSDADVHLSASLLRRVVAAALHEELDFVPLVPRLGGSSFFLEVAIATFMRLVVAGGRLWQVRNPDSRAAVGGGTFNLVRRSAYDRSPGFEFLRLEVGDDICFGQMMKQSGARCAVFAAPEDVRVQYYATFREMLGGLEKNGFAMFSYSVRSALLVTSTLCFLELTPLVAVASPWWSVRATAIVALALMAAAQVVTSRWTLRPLVSALVPCLGILLFLFATSRAVVLTLRRGGVPWRGTFYRLEDLRRGKRLELPF
jgi:hypothetical protein